MHPSDLDDSIRQNAEPTAAWAWRWKVRPGRLGDPPGAATYTGDAGYVRPGWIPILDRLARDLVALGWDRTLDQVKQKAGGLRFYINRRDARPLDEAARSAIRSRIDEATAESFRTCEACGEPGRLCEPGASGWVETLCPRCFEVEDAEARERAATSEREHAEFEAEWRAEEEALAKRDPEYRKYLETFVYPKGGGG